MKEPQVEATHVQRVTAKIPKKVEACKRLAESYHKKREAKKREERVKLEASRVNQYYGIGAVLSPSGLLCWWIFIVPEVVLNLVYLSIFSGLAALMSADIARNQ